MQSFLAVTTTCQARWLALIPGRQDAPTNVPKTPKLVPQDSPKFAGPALLDEKGMPRLSPKGTGGMGNATGGRTSPSGNDDTIKVNEP